MMVMLGTDAHRRSHTVVAADTVGADQQFDSAFRIGRLSTDFDKTGLTSWRVVPLSCGANCRIRATGSWRGLRPDGTGPAGGLAVRAETGFVIQRPGAVGFSECLTDGSTSDTPRGSLRTR